MKKSERELHEYRAVAAELIKQHGYRQQYNEEEAGNKNGGSWRGRWIIKGGVVEVGVSYNKAGRVKHCEMWWLDEKNTPIQRLTRDDVSAIIKIYSLKNL